jgi:hypothetical protein
MMGRWGVVAALALVVLLGWYAWPPGEEAAIRQRLKNLAADFNSDAVGGFAAAGRAASLGSYFTSDVVIEFGSGSEPIHGRETVLAMAARLRPRTSEFTVSFPDIEVVPGTDGATAEVSLTAEIVRRSAGASEQVRDAREFAVTMQKHGGEWRIARVVAVDTLKQHGG